MLPAEIRVPLDLDDATMEMTSWLEDAAIAGPLWVHVNVVVSRLQSHYGSGAMLGVLRESASAYPIHRRLIERGQALAERCDGLVWEAGAVAALLVTCEWGEVVEMVVSIRQAPAATVGDLIRHDLAVPPVPDLRALAHDLL